MKQQIPFKKMHGAGNDFILIDNAGSYFTGKEHYVFSRLCNRHLGIGADGLMLLEIQKNSRWKVRYYNADGKPGSMCGNGARCAAYFAFEKNPQNRKIELKMGNHLYPAEIIENERVRVVWDFEPAVKEIPELETSLPAGFSRILFVDTGSPHLVIEALFLLDDINLAELGPVYRHHRYFAPRGTNVNFIAGEHGEIRIRTFERGVEAETLACGTGAMAAAIAGSNWGISELPVTVHTRGGLLRIGRLTDGGQFWLEGPVRSVYEGSFLLDSFLNPL